MRFEYYIPLVIALFICLFLLKKVYLWWKNGKNRRNGNVN